MAESIRKRAARVPNGENGAAEFDYAKCRAFRNPADFERFLAGYPDKSALLAYYYRLVPKIDLELIGLPETSILKTHDVTQMTPEYAAGRWGRGKYMLRLTDANKPRGLQEAAKTWFEINDPDLKPIYDPRTLVVGDPENADEVARLLATGVLVREAVTGSIRVRSEYQPSAGAAVPPAAPELAPAAVAGDVLSRDLLSTLIIKLVDRGAQSPRDQLTQTIEVAKLLNGSAVSAPAAGVSPEVIELRIKLAVLEDRMQRAGDDAPAAKKDGGGASLDSFDTFLRVQEFLIAQTPRVDAGGGARGWLSQLFDGLKDLAPMVPQVIAGLERMQLGRAPNQNGAGLRINGAGEPGGSAAGVRGPGAPEGARAMPTMPTIEFMPSVNFAAMPSDLDRFKFMAGLALEKFDQGMSGFDFAGWLCAPYTPGGADLYRVLESVGTVGIMSNLGNHPYVVDVGRRAALTAWLDNFFDYVLDVDESPAGDEPRAAAAA